MSNAAAKQSPVPLKFSFPAIFQGRGIMVTVGRNDEHYEVSIDNNLFARVKLEPEHNHWFVMCGELSDSDLLKEIGDRIEARFS